MQSDGQSKYIARLTPAQQGIEAPSADPAQLPAVELTGPAREQALAGWTPVGEGQPQAGTEYLVLLHDGSMVNDWWIEHHTRPEGFFQFSALHSKVTHYRPILARPRPNSNLS